MLNALIFHKVLFLKRNIYRKLPLIPGLCRSMYSKLGTWFQVGTPVFMFAGLTREPLVTMVPLLAITGSRVKAGTIRFVGAVQDNGQRSILQIGADSGSCRGCDGEGPQTK